jgi:hypothetical protein
MVVGLDERHHTYIQALMRRGPLDEKHAKTMFTNLFQSREEGAPSFLCSVTHLLCSSSLCSPLLFPMVSVNCHSGSPLNLAFLLSIERNPQEFCCTHPQQQNGFFDFLGVVNKELDYVQMEIRGSANQYDGILYYGLVNKLANEEAKMGTRFTHVQICLFKAIVSHCFSSFLSIS